MSIQSRYAVAVHSDDMSPRMFKGESVIFDKDEVPRANADVVIALSAGGYLIRKLVSMNEESLQVYTYTPDTTAIMPRNAVAGVYPIVQRCFCSLAELLDQLGLPEVRNG
ncbi:S24 family peptidase [Paraburkholderia sp. BL25I1N1]|uniref:S24 family peptidase n=1 Tax=Paraburkholderia sp. BL25I1N1 TaxID=1938804 RepID=UPI000D3FE236|nr:S24 family peptidase [Paraburkholderia sp. BL25I1N1]PRY03788.1 peptidase S24-like protein [Paraburkholderia sp. BL25I1N1]